MNNSGNNILAVLCKLESEIAYVQKRLVIRNSSESVKSALNMCAKYAAEATLEAEKRIEQTESR